MTAKRPSALDKYLADAAAQGGTITHDGRWIEVRFPAPSGYVRGVDICTKDNGSFSFASDANRQLGQRGTLNRVSDLYQVTPVAPS